MRMTAESERGRGRERESETERGELGIEGSFKIKGHYLEYIVTHGIMKG